MARRIQAGLAGIGVLIGVSLHAASGQGTDTPRLHIDHDPVAKHTLALAMQGAVSRLEHPGCLKVLEDFPDWPGRDVVTKLKASGVSLKDYTFKYISFIDGSDTQQCRKGDPTLAFTAVGEKVVRVCPARVASVARDMSALEILVIHEILHTLGLPENPPSSAAITDRVRRRCL